MKPNTLKDLLGGGHIAIHEVDTIARGLFDGKTTAAGPEGYIIIAVNFDDLPEHVRGFIRKAVLEFKVENVLDVDDADLSDLSNYDPVDANGDAAEPPTVDGEVV